MLGIGHRTLLMQFMVGDGIGRIGLSGSHGLIHGFFHNVIIKVRFLTRLVGRAFLAVALSTVMHRNGYIETFTQQ